MSKVLDKMLRHRVLNVAASLVTIESYLGGVRPGDSCAITASCNVVQAVRELVKRADDMHSVALRVDIERHEPAKKAKKGQGK